MSLHSLVSTFKEIESTNSSNDKLALIKSLSSSDLDLFYHQFVVPQFNIYKTFGITIPKHKKNYPSADIEDLSDSEELRILTEWEALRNSLNNRVLTGNSARETCSKFLDSCPKFLSHYFARFLNKEFLDGVADGSMRKVFGKSFVPTFEIALAQEKDINLLNWSTRYISEPKIDGLRTLIMIDENGNGSALSRNGKPLYNFQFIIENLKSIFGNGVVLDGEIMSDDWNSSVTAVKTETLTDNAKLAMENSTFWCFDILTLEEFLFYQSTKTYSKNLLSLEKRKVKLDIIPKSGIITKLGKIKTITGFNVSSKEEAEKLNLQFLSEGYEGSVLKDLDGIYNYGIREWVKIKDFITKDFRIVDVVFSDGTKKYDERIRKIEPSFTSPLISALVMEVSPGVRANAGTMSDSLRLNLSRNISKIIDTYVEVKCANDSAVFSTDSVRFPCKIIRHRLDK